jgi:acetyl-CoA acetyltransferase
MRDVFVAGVGMTPFQKDVASTISGMATAATTDAMADAQIRPEEVGMVFFGNAMAGLLTGQEMIRAQSALRGTGLLGTPMINVENACASSSSAFHLAWMAVASGQVDVAVAVGAEKMSSPDKTLALRGLASAVDLERVSELEEMIYGGSPTSAAGGDRSLFMDIYADMARRYMDRSGATPEDFAKIAVKSHDNGSLNPLAQYRNRVTEEEVLGSRPISDPLTLLMCSPTGDGAAALALCGPEAAKRLGANVKVRATVVVSGTENGSDQTPVERAARLAYDRAGLGPESVDVAEVHDAAAPAELMMYEELGLCGPGEGPKLLADGATALGGRVPVNPSGGLLSKGHPVGATGCAQLVELTEQLLGRAGDRQVDGARVGLAENAGGYLGPDPAAAVITILSRD